MILSTRPQPKRSIRELCILALMAALIFGTKVALASLPNINLNSVLIILTVLFFGGKSLYTVYVDVLLEGLVFGFRVWWVGELYVWAILVIVTMLFRKNDSALFWAVVAGIFGLCFGLLMYLEWFAINGGWRGFFAMWAAGIPYDLTHCAGNFAFTLVLYRPLRRVMEKLVSA